MLSIKIGVNIEEFPPCIDLIPITCPRLDLVLEVQAKKKLPSCMSTIVRILTFGEHMY